MQRVIDTYQCEWKAALDDPKIRKRFRSFVNTLMTHVELESSW